MVPIQKIILTLNASSRVPVVREYLSSQIILILAFFHFFIMSTNRRSMFLTARGHRQTLKASLQASQSMMNLTPHQLPNEAHMSIPFLNLTSEDRM